MKWLRKKQKRQQNSNSEGSCNSSCKLLTTTFSYIVREFKSFRIVAVFFSVSYVLALLGRSTVQQQDQHKEKALEKGYLVNSSQ